MHELLKQYLLLAAPWWQCKKNAAEHRVAWQSQSDPIEAAKALFPLFVALQKEVVPRHEIIPSMKKEEPYADIFIGLFALRGGF